MNIKPHTWLFASTLIAAAITTTPSLAETPETFLSQYARQAAEANSRFGGFSAKRGKALFNLTSGERWSCASCHTTDPAALGEHDKTGKVIKPLAPAANPARFTRSKKVNKWFKRNCNDVFGRQCTPAEKGDVLTYLLSVRS